MKTYQYSTELPIVLMTYNRPHHTEQVLKALRLHGVQNLYIYSDAPKTQSDLHKVEETRKLFSSIDWTTPKIHFQEENIGLAKSIRTASDTVFQSEDFIIVLEDDCVPKQYFLEFMFQCYQRYADNPKIYGISGYTVQHKEESLLEYPYDLYFSPRIGSWGWGTWKHKWSHHERNLEELLRRCSENNIDLNQGGTDVPELIRMMNSREANDLWTIHWILSVYLARGFYIYPTKSHIENIGMDGSGVHCGISDRFNTQIASKRPIEYPQTVVLDKKLYTNFRSYYDSSPSDDSEKSFHQLENSLRGHSHINDIAPPKVIYETKKQKTRVLNITQSLGLGGATRCMIAAAKYSQRLGDFEHAVVELREAPKQNSIEYIEAHGLEALQIHGITSILEIIDEYDIVIVHWWNSPEMDHFLRSDLPPVRMSIWAHVGGFEPPQVITKELIDFPDFFIAGSPLTYNCPPIEALSDEERYHNIGMAYDPTDFERLAHFEKKSHEKFNVGYVGTVSFIKMHEAYVKMSSLINIPDVNFIVCGVGAAQKTILDQSAALGIQDKFELKGHVENIASELAVFDIFGYPLCRDNYAAAELVLQEAMYVGIPSVVFPYGGVKYLVVDNFTGLIVKSEQEYAEAIEYLYYNKDERIRIGENAANYARQIFGAENTARKINTFLSKLLKRDKTKKVWGRNETAIIEIDQDSGATKFIKNLGHKGEDFATSLSNSDLNEVFKAEARITKISPLLHQGGIQSYLDFYKDDPYLHFWSGLAHLGSKKYEASLNDLLNAQHNGFLHWRCYWYLGVALFHCDMHDEALEVFESIKHLAREFKQIDHYLDQLQMNLIHLGSEYGGWSIPLNLLKSDSICYCVGVGEDITFDLAVIERFGCTVKAFDPTPRSKVHVEGVAPGNEKYHFYSYGLWHEDTELTFFPPENPEHVSHSVHNLQNTTGGFTSKVKKLSTIMNELGHNHIDLLKIDIEGAEYSVIENIISEQINIRALCVEYHDMKNDPYARERSIQALTDYGFRLIHENVNDYLFIMNQSVHVAAY